MLNMSLFKASLIPLALLISGCIYKRFPYIKQDNIVEELIEEGIRIKTGIDIDLSPDTPEVKDGDN